MSSDSVFAAASKGIKKDREELQEEDIDEFVTTELETEVPLDKLVYPGLKIPQDDNDKLVELILRTVNGNKGTAASSSIFGSQVIEPGKIGVILNNGRVEVVGPGRYMIFSPRAAWGTILTLDQNVINFETLTIVRVPKGEFGLATESGKSIVLGEGIHIYNTRLFQHISFKSQNQKHIHHGTIHLLLVPKGEYALVTENTHPKVLKQGHYSIDSSLFTLHSFVNVNQPHIQHKTIHIIRVCKGEVGLINYNNRPKLIYEGTHVFNSQTFSYNGTQNINQEKILHGTITRFRVRNGEIGLAWEDNRPIFVDKAGFYEFDNPSFAYVKCVSASDKEIVLGSRKRIVVYDGEVGISYRDGKLEVLEPATHTFDASERIFSGFLSTQQQCLRLKGEDGGNLLRCETKDFVAIGIKSDVFYKIASPSKTLLVVGNQQAITKLISETAIATLQSIVRSSSLNEVAQSKEPLAVSEKRMLQSQGETTAPSAPLFFDKVHDEFLSRLHDNFLDHYGIQIGNIRICSFKILDTELAENIQKQAMITAQTETKLANLQGQKEIATAEMERDAEVLRIRTDSQARQMAVDTAATNKATMDQAEAEAQAVLLIARGEAEGLLLKADAEAKAIERKAQAEARRAELLSATPLGGQLAMYHLQSDMVTKTLAGVQKLVYLPTSGNSSNPFGLFSIPGLQPQLDGLATNQVSTD